VSTDTFRGATGRKVVSRGSAEQLGTADHFVLDADKARIIAIVVGSAKKAKVIDWERVVGFGPDAAMVDDDDALRTPNGERETRAANGAFDLVGRRVLTQHGNEIGALDDVTFDATSGDLVQLQVGGHTLPTSALRGAGSYAVVVDTEPEA